MTRPGYADRIVANSQALGAALVSFGVPCVTDGSPPPDGPRYSRSHSLLMRVAEFGTAETVAVRLEAAGIITTGGLLPDALGGHGIRLGTQEISRRGMTSSDMGQVAGLITEALRGDRPAAAMATDVETLVRRFPTVQFTWPA